MQGQYLMQAAQLRSLVVASRPLIPHPPGFEFYPPGFESALRPSGIPATPRTVP